jgi:hypothetical protein
MLTRLRTVTAALLTLVVVGVGAATLAVRPAPHAASPAPARPPADAAAESEVREQPAPWEVAPPLPADAPRPRAEKPPRVLVFAAAPTPEYLFLVGHLLGEEKKGRADVTLCLQTPADKGGPQADVPDDRFLDGFPETLKAAKPEGKERDAALSAYDLIVAVDPDWSRLTAEQTALLGRWVEDGGGLIFVAGKAHVQELAPPGSDRAVRALRDLLPVVLEERKPQWNAPNRANVTLHGPFDLVLQANETGPPPARPEEPELNFYTYYPVRVVKEQTQVVTALDDPEPRKDSGPQPYLAVMPVGKGRTVYLSAGAAGRCRGYRREAHARFWTALLKLAADRK